MAVVRQALGQVDPARVRGVAVASMAEAGLLLDVAGRPVTPFIAWYDSRSDPQYRRWLDQFGDERFLPIAGNRPNPIFGIFKLQWLRDNEPDAYAAAARWLHVADYIAFRLCGVQATDYSLATRTMLFDLPNLCWSDALIEAAGLRADLLPAAVPAGTRLGGVTPEAAAATGLPAGIAVGCGGHDHICGALAAGAYQEGAGLNSMGTAEVAFLPLDTLRLGAAGGAARCSFSAHVARGKYCAMKGIRSSGAAITWAAGLLDLGDAGAASYDRMQAAAAQAPPGSRGVFFLPRLAPIDRGAFIGLTAAAGPAELARAVYEGLAYEWRAYLEAIEQATRSHATHDQADRRRGADRAVGADQGRCAGPAAARARSEGEHCARRRAAGWASRRRLPRRCRGAWRDCATPRVWSRPIRATPRCTIAATARCTNSSRRRSRRRSGRLGSLASEKVRSLNQQLYSATTLHRSSNGGFAATRRGRWRNTGAGGIAGCGGNVDLRTKPCPWYNRDYAPP